MPVLWNDPNAAKVWLLEMGQKAGTSGIGHTRSRLPLAVDWPWMTLPWAVFATMGAVLPLTSRGSSWRPRVWFPWFWGVGNLLMFCFWSVAKPNYFLPCLPAAAILAGVAFVRVTRAARLADSKGVTARRILQGHWVLLFAGAILAPVLVAQRAPEALGWALAMATAVGLGVIASALAWRRGADFGVMLPLTGATVVGLLVGYGAIAPAQNARHSHRELAQTLEHLLPPEATTVMFFHELDEGLWFYLRGRELVPVPGSQPEYNDALRIAEDQRHHRLEFDPAKRVETQKALLVNWLKAGTHPSPYVLIRADRYDLFADALVGLVEPVHRENALERNELMLLRLVAPSTGDPTPILASPRPEAAGADSRRQ